MRTIPAGYHVVQNTYGSLGFCFEKCWAALRFKIYVCQIVGFYPLCFLPWIITLWWKFHWFTSAGNEGSFIQIRVPHTSCFVLYSKYPQKNIQSCQKNLFFLNFYLWNLYCILQVSCCLHINPTFANLYVYFDVKSFRETWDRTVKSCFMLTVCSVLVMPWHMQDLKWQKMHYFFLVLVP